MDVQESEAWLEGVRDAIRSEPHASLHGPLRLSVEHDALVLEGEVEDVMAKKLVLERAAAHPRVTRIVDRLHVAPSSPMDDASVRDRVVDALVQEPAFQDLSLYVSADGARRPMREKPLGPSPGWISVRVEDGVVTLDGDVPSLSHKRLAGVLAWWISGVRDVLNGLGVEPPQEDSDEEIVEALRLILEKDPFVDPTGIRVRSRGSVVTLEGAVDAESARKMAEYDAWATFGVDRVENRLAVPRPEPPRSAPSS